MDHSQEQEAKRHNSKWHEWRTPTGVGVAVTLMTAFLSFLGYGYALAVESQFGLPESLFADSPLDYLRLSSRVVTHWFTALPEALLSPTFYQGVYSDWMAWNVFLTVLWFIAVMLWLFDALRRRAKEGVTAVLTAIRISRFWLCLMIWVRRLSWPVFSLVGIWTWVPAGAWLLTATLIALGLMLTFVPLIGYFTGLHNLQRWVVEPTVCMSPVSRDDRIASLTKKSEERGNRSREPDNREKPRAVPCVQVHVPDDKGGSAFVQGRLVVSSAKWAILFNPEDGAVWRIPIENTRVDLVSMLPKLAASGVGTSMSGAVAPTPATTAGSGVGIVPSPSLAR